MFLPGFLPFQGLRACGKRFAEFQELLGLVVASQLVMTNSAFRLSRCKTPFCQLVRKYKKRLLSIGFAAISLLVTNGFATGRITDLKCERDVVVLVFETTPHEYYQPQCSTNIIDGEWLNLGGELIAVSNETQKVCTQDLDGCFFRVLKVDRSESFVEPSSQENLPPPPPVITPPSS